MKTAVYPGSFDPITLGHLDIIERASSLFDRVVVAVLVNKNKTPMFTIEERKEMIREATQHLDNVIVDSFEGLLVDFVKVNGFDVVIKGLRAVSDFEAEFQMASMNRVLMPDIETVFMMTSSQYSYLSSSLVKEVFKFKGCISELVPGLVIEAMKDKYLGTKGALK